MTRFCGSVVLLGIALLVPGRVSRAEEESRAVKPTTLLFAGDSITGWSDLSKYLKFSHIVDCMAEARWGAGRMVVMNRGKGGDSTADLLKRLPGEDRKSDV